MAARFEVPAANAIRLGQKGRARAYLAPAKRNGPRPSSIAVAMVDWLKARLGVKPDLTMRALAAGLRERGTPVIYGRV